ncbi:uncharacterized protein DUF1794 [Jatrophihabitans sp. GAS493]|uniref:FABP family protein n=1 Tax=Jatrophihabitans sp. GAS493 TaxID=1907575 RepID=UPI000BB8D432|nr:FABP family protein [Jatrophihabitans sp. GAS493]SOD70733.1 uncharacterized protein DUF1794 [Jatrophihabitans sp. GAS493]
MSEADSPEPTNPTPDTTDLRTGAPLHDRLLAVLPLVGQWRGAGQGVVPSTGVEFHYGQEVTFSHDGRPFLAYQSRSWLLDNNNEVIRQAQRETGFWRCGPGEDDIEALITTIVGVSLLHAGRAGDLHWELESVSSASTPTAERVGGERRFYALRGEDLFYATELAPIDASTGLAGAFAPHLNASLRRV